MSFRFVPNSVTLDNLERRNSCNRRVISPNSVAFRADYVKVVEDTPTTSAAEMQAKESSYYYYNFVQCPCSIFCDSVTLIYACIIIIIIFVIVDLRPVCLTSIRLSSQILPVLLNGN